MSKLGDIAMETNQNKARKENRIIKKKQSISNNFQQLAYVCLESLRRIEMGTEKYLKK